MNLPFFFLKILIKLYNRVKNHIDHTNKSFFHHGLVKLIFLADLKKKNCSWKHFLFWYGFELEKIANQEEAEKSVGKQQKTTRKE